MIQERRNTASLKTGREPRKYNITEIKKREIFKEH